MSQCYISDRFHCHKSHIYNLCQLLLGLARLKKKTPHNVILQQQKNISCFSDWRVLKTMLFLKPH